MHRNGHDSSKGLTSTSDAQARAHVRACTHTHSTHTRMLAFSNGQLCYSLTASSHSLHIILLGVGGTIYNIHTLESFKDLGLDSQRAKRLHLQSVNHAAKVVHTRRALSSTYQLSSGTGFRSSCNPPDPH